MKKAATKAESAYMDKVSRIGCICCRDSALEEPDAWPPCEIHHIREMTGAALRSSNFDVLGLCPTHHRLGNLGVAVHAGIETWERRWGTQRELVERTQREAGYVAKEVA